MGFKMKRPPYKTHSKKVPFSNEHLYGGDDDTDGPYGMHPIDWKSPERIEREKKEKENNKNKKK